MSQKTWAGLRPTRTILLEEATLGGSKSSGLKGGHYSNSPSSLCSATCSLADEPEAPVMLDPFFVCNFVLVFFWGGGGGGVPLLAMQSY